MISLSKRTKGFTIVELLIVIVVIGILAGLVITTYSGIQQRARNTVRQTDLKAVQSQLEAYYATNGYYPANSTTDGLGSDSSENQTFVTTNMKGLDPNALRDPTISASSTNAYSLLTSAPAAGVLQYAYIASPASCDDSTTLCTGYQLIANEEGSTDTYTYKSLN
ncbi:MAG TPA: prepilin-type N-terminal cleavage/methylation domain-containing protein [Candidatus Saccharimonadales bacterium]